MRNPLPDDDGVILADPEVLPKLLLAQLRVNARILTGLHWIVDLLIVIAGLLLWLVLKTA